ncbi:hypothetical protein C5167_027392 [Papaver somniferum]|uniref:probable WRKY transcription factor 41 n=1 Tax=Papaver somniferum TaxID=3469 RepID=UPI000E6FCA85|nr:probable WRKY transcription factor 41 [Papaver somniferum]RZC91329.1 hypothetical protein C5167_027392 [Papaver somniferum]
MSTYFKMEKNTSMSLLDQKPLIVNQLTQAKDLLNQLQFGVDVTSTSGKLLLPGILSSFESSLSMLSGIKSEAGFRMTGLMQTADSPRSVSRSPRSNSNLIGNPSKKRKTIPSWTEQVRACEQSGLEEPVYDGFSWRKYGHKDIYGANHPRGYYRCTHKNSQGCLATKQVQRTDTDTSIFSVMYLGRHTCVQASLLQPGQPQKKLEQHDKKRKRKSQETLINFQTGGHVNTKDYDTTQVVLTSPSFSFPSASIPIPCKEKESESNICSSQLTPDNHFMSSPLSSPSTSGSNSLFSPYRANIEGGQDLQTSDCDLCEFTSALPLALDSPELYLDWDWDSFDGFCF